MLFWNPSCLQLAFVYFRFLCSPFLMISRRTQEASPALSKIVIKLMHWTQAVITNKRVSHGLPVFQQRSPAPPTVCEKKGRGWGVGLDFKPKSWAFQVESHRGRTPESQLAICLHERAKPCLPPGRSVVHLGVLVVEEVVCTSFE